MTDSCAADSALDLSRRLGPAPTFDDASARLEAALDELRATEVSLERRLSALRRYMVAEKQAAPDQTACAA